MLLNNYSGFILEAGCDEAGRGCLAGPVFAAAVILPELIPENKLHLEFMTLINDSKKLSEKNRNNLVPIIQEIAISRKVTPIYPTQIDEINILNASILGMQECVLKLKPKPEFVIIDGNSPFISKKGFFKDFSKSEIKMLSNLKTCSIIKGDSKYMSIAASSVLAKTYRDKYMSIIHEEFPEYNWQKNKGYPTKEHCAAIKKYGLTKYHRLSFKVPYQ